jgi:hypothetical protein
MRTRTLVTVFALALTGAVTSCDDDISGIDEGFDDTATWRADLNGANERPTPINTPATGRAWFTDNGTTITYYIEFDGLVAPMSNAHIHRIPTDPTQAGPVMVQLAVLNGAQEGVLAGVIDMRVADISTEAGTQSPDELRTLLNNGGTYVNIHSSSGTTPNTGFPAGEIRGDLRRQ